MIGALAPNSNAIPVPQIPSAARVSESPEDQRQPNDGRNIAETSRTTGAPFRLSGPNALIALQAKENDRQDGDAKRIGELTEEEQAQVQALKERDREVRAHEAAHAAAGAGLAGSPSFTFEVGPDGQRYAVAGEVSIDTSAVDGDPDATIRKLQQVVRAALAPAEPSGQDRAVAAQAQAQMNQARAEAATERREEQQAGANSETDAGEKISGQILSLVA